MCIRDSITDVSVSFEVFADDEAGMEAEAREIATWADNVYVKIPALNTKGCLLYTSAASFINWERVLRY